MTEKYIDLGPRIFNTTGLDMPSKKRLASIHCVLRWLDEHPDQVPGRTISASKFRNACEGLAVQQRFAVAIAVAACGIVIDPTPTSLPSAPGAAVKMRKHHQWVRTVTGSWISTDGSILDEDGAQEIADEHGFEIIHDGVTATGGDDEH